MGARTGSIRVVLDHWPIVLHVSEGLPSEDDFDAYVREATAVLLRGEKHAVVMDTTRLAGASTYGRMMKKEWMQQYGDRLRQTCVGTAMAISSPLLRFVSGSLMLIRPLPTPYFICETPGEAMDWARQRLLDAGIVLPRSPSDHAPGGT